MLKCIYPRIINMIAKAGNTLIYFNSKYTTRVLCCNTQMSSRVQVLLVDLDTYVLSNSNRELLIKIVCICRHTAYISYSAFDRHIVGTNTFEIIGHI